MALVEEELPGVTKVRQDFQVREDGVIAHRLQEAEFDEHFNSNVQLRRTARHDVGIAKDLQTKEVLSYREKEERRRRELQEREDQDREQAAKLAAKLKEEEEVEAALKLQDELMAKKIFEREQRRMAELKRQELEDARLARQESVKEEHVVRERRRDEEELSQREIRRMRELQLQRSEAGGGGQPLSQRSKYTPQGHQPGQQVEREQPRPPPSASLQSTSREQPPRSAQASKYTSHAASQRQPSSRHAPPEDPSVPPPYEHYQQYEMFAGFEEKGFEEPAPMDENDRIALQEEEDERIAREMLEREESERQRREREDQELARKLYEREKEAARRQKAQSAATATAEPDGSEILDIELAKRLQREEIEAEKRRRQLLKQKKAQAQAERQAQGLPTRQGSYEGRPTQPPTTTGWSPTQSAPPGLVSARNAQTLAPGQPPPGHPFNPTPVSQYRPGMTGVHVTRTAAATLPAAGQPKPSHRRTTDAKKGKKKK